MKTLSLKEVNMNTNFQLADRLGIAPSEMEDYSPFYTEGASVGEMNGCKKLSAFEVVNYRLKHFDYSVEFVVAFLNSQMYYEHNKIK